MLHGVVRFLLRVSWQHPVWVQVFERKQAASQNLMGVRGRCVARQLIDIWKKRVVLTDTLRVGRIRLDLKLDGPGRPARAVGRLGASRDGTGAAGTPISSRPEKKSFKISSQTGQCGVMSFARAVSVFDMMFCAYRSPVCVKMTYRSVKYAVACVLREFLVVVGCESVFPQKIQNKNSKITALQIGKFDNRNFFF